MIAQVKTVTITVEYLSGATRPYEVHPAFGWRHNVERNVLTLWRGRGTPRTEIPLGNVANWTIETSEDDEPATTVTPKLQHWTEYLHRDFVRDALVIDGAQHQVEVVTVIETSRTTVYIYDGQRHLKIDGVVMRNYATEVGAAEDGYSIPPWQQR